MELSPRAYEIQCENHDDKREARFTSYYYEKNDREEAN